METCVLLTGVVRIESQDQHPMLDHVANKVIQKFRIPPANSCGWRERRRLRQTPAEVKAVQLLRGDPQMRALFLNKVAAPIANKMIECEMIP